MTDKLPGILDVAKELVKSGGAIPEIHPVARWDGNVLRTLGGDELMLCSCGLLYPLEQVNAHGWTSCSCGRLGQRFDGTLIEELSMWRIEHTTNPASVPGEGDHQ